ncbi:MAG TPA: hypothetical protein VH437_15820 [Terriglobales bacterium]
MRALLVHPEDDVEAFAESQAWDLVIDLARAPASTYEMWSRRARCRVISLFDLADQSRDLLRVREFLQYGMNQMRDNQGLDWWDILSVSLVPDLLRLLQAQRLATELGAGCELHATRPDWLCSAIAAALGARLEIDEKCSRTGLRLVRHYYNAMQKLNSAQFLQVLQDKFDPQHKARRHLRPRSKTVEHSVVLLPSAYINVSRTAVEYARVLPSVKFLLVCARQSARLHPLPANVFLEFLDPYFVGWDEQELRHLRGSWIATKAKLVDAPVWRLAHSAGMLNSMPSSLEWGIAIRNAWNEVFESRDVTACLSPDDSNPYTRIALIISKQRGRPALACHHGALDYMMAIKRHHEDVYLAKSEMERDYLERICNVTPEKIVVGNATDSGGPTRGDDSDKSWVVFFSEPYSAWGWRTEEVYREILPPMATLAETLDLKLVIKIHPFESVKYHRRLLLRYLGSRLASTIEVLEGTFSSLSWSKVKMAMTVQSTVGLECARRGIPVFFCQWLQDAHSGYLSQFARFNIGYLLKSVDGFAQIPQLLSVHEAKHPAGIMPREIAPRDFQFLLENDHSFREAAVAL